MTLTALAQDLYDEHLYIRGYNPAHDPEFVEDFIMDLLDHRGEWRHPGRVIVESRDPSSPLLAGGEGAVLLADYSRKAANLWRAHGDIIEGHNIRGYRWLGRERPQRPEPDPDVRRHRKQEGRIQCNLAALTRRPIPVVPGQLSIAQAPTAGRRGNR